MILSICPNPSIDYTVELDSLNVGMLNRVNNKTETYSGKALNVAMALARLGENSFATGFMFEKHAKLFEQKLDKEGVKHNFVCSPGGARLNYKIIDKKSMLTEINDKGETVTMEKQSELLSLVENISKEADFAVVSGSLPSGVKADYYYKLFSCMPQRVKKVADAEWQNMEQALKAGLFLIKPNLKELEVYVKGTLSSKADIISASRKLIEKGTKYVLTSLGSEGAILTDGVESYYCKSASVAVNSTVGAGDCMVATACACFNNGLPPAEVLRHSVAAGTAAITTSGTNLFTKEKYEEIYTKIFTEKI